MNQQETDEKYMRRCLQLAANGRQNARPNPMVGAVIVVGNAASSRIIGEGYHVRCGEGHAEVNAFASVRKEDEPLLKEATIYVSLEPCSHYGKTPPCADLIIKKGVRRVVVGCIDEFAKVQGRGIQKLRDAGIEVTVGVLEEQCRWLNRRFFTFMEKQRPYIILKWAESSDGFMAPESKGRYWISNQRQTIISHRMRTQEAAILVGSQTYLDDQPQLTARLYGGDNPLPIVLDRRGRLHDVPEHWLHLRCQTLAEVMQLLFERKIQSLIVEGGRKVLDAFIAEGLYDEVVVFKGKQSLGAGLEAPALPPLPEGRLSIIC